MAYALLVARKTIDRLKSAYQRTVDLRLRLEPGEGLAEIAARLENAHNGFYRMNALANAVRKVPGTQLCGGRFQVLATSRKSRRLEVRECFSDRSGIFIRADRTNYVVGDNSVRGPTILQDGYDALSELPRSIDAKHELQPAIDFGMRPLFKNSPNHCARGL